jgi:hypothetical protein
MARDPAMSASFKERAWHEAKSFFVIFLYVWAILAFFTMHKNFLLQRPPFTGQLLAIINAVILGKVILILEWCRVGEGMQKRAAVWRILGKSMLFGLLLLTFYTVEGSLRGLFHHKSLSQSIAEIDEGKLLEMGTLALLMMVSLLPYFFLREVLYAIGRAKLMEILFSRPTVEGKPPA